MEILRFKVITACPRCWANTDANCRICNGTGEVEDEVDMDTMMFQLEGQLRKYDYIHDHGHGE